MDAPSASESEKYHAAVIRCSLAANDVRSREDELLRLAWDIAAKLCACIRVKPFQANGSLGIRASKSDIDQLPFILAGNQIQSVNTLGECHSDAEWGILVTPPEKSGNQPTSIRLDQYRPSSDSSEVA